MNIRHVITFSFLLLLPATFLMAQETDTLRQSESLTYEKMMDELSGAVNAPAYIDNAMTGYITRNSSRRNMCYRIRIFFNNSQNARSVSSEIVREFSERYPDIPVFNQYVNPYFKVTVGNFRTKSDAMKFMTDIKPHYSSAFLVREPFTISSARN